MAVFMTLAIAAWAEGVSSGERTVYRWVLQQTSPQIVIALGWINYAGDVRFLIPATLPLALAVSRTRPRRWWLCPLVVLAAPALEGIAKAVVGRPRPELTGMGFPSGHVTAAAAFVVLLAYLAEQALDSRRARLMVWGGAAMLIALVAMARVLLRAHWPLDTVAGAALGLSCAAAGAWWNEHTAPAGLVPRRAAAESRSGR
jgi:membrane-associated phospholipid phosphatase